MLRKLKDESLFTPRSQRDKYQLKVSDSSQPIKDDKVERKNTDNPNMLSMLKRFSIKTKPISKSKQKTFSRSNNDNSKIKLNSTYAYKYN